MKVYSKMVLSNFSINLLQLAEAIGTFTLIVFHSEYFNIIKRWKMRSEITGKLHTSSFKNK